MRISLYWLGAALALAACGSVNQVADDGGSGTCELTECGTECVDTTTSAAHCGGCDMACGAEQACVDSACEEVTAEFATTPRDPTGWVTADGSPLELTFVPVEIDGAIYECRTGPEMMIGSLSFGPCDDGDGTQPVHIPVPNPAQEEGSYQTEMRVRVGDFVSAAASVSYYAHHSLDVVATCPQPFTDAEIFAAAGPQLLAGDPPPFGSTTQVRNPFITIPFTNVAPNSPAMQSPPWTNITGQSFTLQASSLRRRFALSSSGQLLLVQRQYVSRRASLDGETDMGRLCRNGISYRTSFGQFGDSNLDCQTMVLNSRGFSRCVIDVNGSPTVQLPSVNGFIKLNSKSMFSPKGASIDCPSNKFFPGGCAIYMVLPM